MKGFVEALDAIGTQVWAALFILIGAGLLLTHRGSTPGQTLLGAGLIVFRIPTSDKGTGTKNE